MTTTAETRSRTVTWHDPRRTAAGAEGRTGLQFLRAIAAGELPPPPIGFALGFALVEVDDGLARFRGEPAEYQYNPMGAVHGGWAATLLDSTMGCAVMTALDAATAYSTAQLSIHLVRAITVATGPVLAEGRLIHCGSRIATAEGHLRDGQGRLLAHGTTTCAVFPRR